MRLRLAILRHALPPCHILFTTGSGPASFTTARTATIADILADINAIVPLESSDGAWGLEDYVIEVATKADQEIRYECLHYSEIESVLREDDEVVVRGLKTEELRERRIGGRFQISGDGRHLVDGVAWGKRWLRAEMGRPGVRIPGRKRRRLLLGGEGGDEEEVLAIMDVGNAAQDELVGDDGDDENDSLYHDENEDGEGRQLQI